MAAITDLKPLVTVLLPVYNGADTLSTAIQSILSQDCEEWDLLIIDDASSDDSVSIISSFEDSRITLICHSENQGLSATLNHGVSLIESKYVMRMDQDDICFPNRISAQVRYLEDNTEIDLIGCRCLYFHGETFWPMGVIDVPENHDELSAKRHGIGFALAHPSFMGKAQWFLHNPYCSEFDGAEDRELLLRAADSSVYGCAPDVLLAYRVNKISLRSNFRRRRLLVKAVREHGNYFRAFGTAVRQYSTFFFYLCGIQGIHWWLRSKPSPGVCLEWAKLWQRMGVPNRDLAGKRLGEIGTPNLGNWAVLVKSLVSAFLIHGLVLGLSLAITLLGTRFLERSAFGMFAYSQAWLNFTVLLASLGVHTAGMAVTASNLKEGTLTKLQGFFNWHDRTTNWTGIGGGLLLFAILGFAFPLGDGNLIWACIASACVLPLVKANNTESIVMGFKRVVLARLLAPVTQKGLQVLVVFSLVGLTSSDLSVTHFYIGLLSGAILSLGISHFVRRNLLRNEFHFDSRENIVREENDEANSVNWWQACLPQLATGVSLWAIERTDLIVLGMFRPMEEVANYEIAYRIAALMTVIPLVVSFVAGPMFAENAKSERVMELQRSVGRATVTGFLGVGLGAGLLFIWGESILSLFGVTYLAANPILRILLVGVFLKTLFGPALVVLNMAGRGREAMRIMLWAISLNVVMAFVAVPIWGSTGAAWATVVSGVLASAWLARVVTRDLDVVPYSFRRK